MKTTLRIYSWFIFPVIATIHIAIQVPVLALNIMNNFTYGRFYGRAIPDEWPFTLLPEITNRWLFAIAEPFQVLYHNLQSLNSYKF